MNTQNTAAQAYKVPTGWHSAESSMAMTVEQFETLKGLNVCMPFDCENAIRCVTKYAAMNAICAAKKGLKIVFAF